MIKGDRLQIGAELERVSGDRGDRALDIHGLQIGLILEVVAAAPFGISINVQSLGEGIFRSGSLPGHRILSPEVVFLS